MKLLGSPGGVAVCALLLALAAHPAMAPYRQEPSGVGVVVLLALLFVVAAILRGLADLGTAVVALGVAMMAGAVGYDALRGHQGELSLRAGEGRQRFEETGPARRRLGLRPLDATVAVETITDEEATLAVDERGATRRERLAPDGAVSVGRFRLGWERRVLHSRLVIALEREGTTRTVELASDEPATLEGLEIALERYFPDFALDDKNQPFTRSQEPRNPAALLHVQRGDRPWRVLVLQSMPGIHDVPEIGWRFALRGVLPDPELVIGVHDEPGVWLAAGGAFVAVAGLLIGWRRHLAVPRLAWLTAAAPIAGLVVYAALRGSSRVSVALVMLTVALAAALIALSHGLWRQPAGRGQASLALAAGTLFVVLLVAGADRTVLAWRFAASGAELPGVGLVLGLLLLAALAGTLLLAADRLTRGASRHAGALGRRALLLAVGLGIIASGLMVKEAGAFDGVPAPDLAAAGAGVAAATWLLALGAAWLHADGRASTVRSEPEGAHLASLAAALGIVALLAVGQWAWERHGTYASTPAMHALSAALAGIAAAQPTGFPLARLLAFIAALLGAITASFA